MFIYIWIVILGILWLKWTIDAIYNLLLYISYYYEEKRKFWVKMGKPYFDTTSSEVWAIIHFGLLFLVSLTMWLESMVD